MNLEFLDELPERQVGRRRGPAAWTVELAESLKAHPGQWVKWPRETKGVHAVANNVKKGSYPMLRGCEVLVVNKVCYIRWPVSDGGGKR